MTYEDWVVLFGRSTFDPRVRAALAQAGVKETPVIPRGELFTLVQVGEGIMVNFSDEGMFKNLEEQVGARTPIVASVTVLLADPRRVLYSGPLPFDLRRSDGREELRARFGEPQDGSDLIPADEWTIEGLVLRVFYAEDFKTLIRLRLTHPDAN